MANTINTEQLIQSNTYGFAEVLHTVETENTQGIQWTTIAPESLTKSLNDDMVSEIINIDNMTLRELRGLLERAEVVFMPETGTKAYFYPDEKPEVMQ